MNLEAHIEEGERTLAHIWKAMALRGAVAIAFAVLILVWPSIGLTALIALFGAFALISGLATIAGTFSVPLPGKRRAWLVVEGLLGVAVGIAVFVWPGLSALGLLYAIAFQMCASVRSPSCRCASRFIMPVTPFSSTSPTARRPCVRARRAPR